MREIEQDNAFKRDIRRESKGINLAALNTELPGVLDSLLKGIPLDTKYRDHKLTGEWEGCRDCHLKPNLIMIYEMDDDILTLHRLGSHAELFG